MSHNTVIDAIFRALEEAVSANWEPDRVLAEVGDSYATAVGEDTARKRLDAQAAL